MFTTEKFFDVTQFPYKELFNDITNVWEAIAKIDSFIALQFSGGLVANYKDRKDVFIGEGTIIEEGVFIKGPALIGKNCVIRHGAYLRENVILGNTVLVHHGSELKHAIMLNNSFAPHVGYVGDSIVGNGVNIAAGVVLANYRFDKKEVHISHADGKIPTGLKKFGSIIGDGASVGANAVLNPGTVLEKGVVVYPLKVVSGFHKENEIVR
jgi:UDP-N-acetylglucosamine diphosphorylase / glucose-1-phosphate thymidylyltransferase / UDP-N-acetylgalactosamine diphosphorylase / glucosamine-1-phosphate N-acetyltransferase / galactosamine-1-phosphate N-acetyltransferase